MKILILIVTVLITVSCVTKMIEAPTKIRESQNYKIGEVKTASIGEPIFTVRKAIEVPAFVATSSFTPPKAGIYGELKINKGDVFAVNQMTKDGDVLIRSSTMPKNLFIRIGSNGMVADPSQFKKDSKTGLVSNKNGARGWYSMEQHTNIYGTPVGQPASVKIAMQEPWPEGKLFEQRQEGVPQAGSFMAEVVYSGKTGETIKATYREYSNDLIRASFAQDLSYNLNESKEIAYKSVKILVKSATNSKITYQVVDDGGLPWVPNPQQ